MKYFHPRKYWRLTKEWLHDFFWYYLLPDAWEIRYHFKEKVGYSPNLRDPKSFNEKIQWIKLNDRNNIYPDLIDKFKVKEIVKNILGEEYVIPTLFGPFFDATDIPWDELPNQFVLKCNHDAASVIICKDKTKLNIKKTEEFLNLCLHKNYYHEVGKQWGYKNIKPCIFVEKYMRSALKADIDDYKFMVFNGQCKCILYCSDRYSKNGMKKTFFSPDWNVLPFKRPDASISLNIEKPSRLDDMLNTVSKLYKYVSSDFVRIDLYDINGNIYFGEFTFYPSGGLESFEPEEWDFEMGKWLTLTNK